MRCITIACCVVGLAISVGCRAVPDEPTSPAIPDTAPGSPSPSPVTIGTALPVIVTASTASILSSDEIDKLEPDHADGSDVADVLAEIRHGTLEMTEIRGTITAHCPHDHIEAAPGAVTTCTSTFDGIPVKWDVVFDVNQEGGGEPGSLLTYTVDPESALLTRAEVYANFWSTYGSNSPQLRCDRIPRVVRVDVGFDADDYAKTRYQCQYLGPVEDDNTRSWENYPVTIDEDGQSSFGY